MAKKRLADSDFDVPESGFDASTAVAKLPTDIRGGKEVLAGFMNLPVDLLTPFALKDGSDFSRPTGRFYEQFLASIIEVVEKTMASTKSWQAKHAGRPQKRQICE